MNRRDRPVFNRRDMVRDGEWVQVVGNLDGLYRINTQLPGTRRNNGVYLDPELLPGLIELLQAYQEWLSRGK